VKDRLEDASHFFYKPTHILQSSWWLFNKNYLCNQISLKSKSIFYNSSSLCIWLQQKTRRTLISFIHLQSYFIIKAKLTYYIISLIRILSFDFSWQLILTSRHTSQVALSTCHIPIYTLCINIAIEKDDIIWQFSTTSIYPDLRMIKELGSTLYMLVFLVPILHSILFRYTWWIGNLVFWINYPS